MTNIITNQDDVINVRNVITRVEQLEALRDADPGKFNDLNNTEYMTLTRLLDDLAGYDGDECWRGNYYPTELIHDSHFKAYTVAMAYETGAISKDNIWPINCVDWNKAAARLQDEYSAVDFGGVTYWSHAS